MSIDKNYLLKLIKEVKSELNEITPPTPGSTPAVNQNATQPNAVVNKNTTQPNQTPPQETNQEQNAAVQFPKDGLLTLQGFSDFLFTSKNPKYALLKPWLQSLGVKVK